MLMLASCAGFWLNNVTTRRLYYCIIGKYCHGRFVIAHLDKNTYITLQINIKSPLPTTQKRDPVTGQSIQTHVL